MVSNAAVHRLHAGVRLRGRWGTKDAPGTLDAETATHSDAGDLLVDDARGVAQHLARAARRRPRLAAAPSARRRLIAISAFGVLVAAAVAITTARNPVAEPQGIAVPLRVIIILSLVGTGVFAQTSELQARMGRLLIGAGLFAAAWLLNGSGNPVLFSIGSLLSGVYPLLIAGLMLAHPSGRLRSHLDTRYLWVFGGISAGLWLLPVVMTAQPPLKGPLLQCAPHCPDNVFSLGGASMAVPAVRLTLGLAWFGLTLGVPVLLVRRARSASAPLRKAIAPVIVLGVVQAAVLGLDLALSLAGAPGARAAGAVFIASVAAVPVAILVGLLQERMYMGQSLARFVSEIATSPQSDPEAMLAAALHDPTLTVAYRRPKLGTYVDFAGNPVTLRNEAAITWIQRSRLPVAAVMYDPALAEQERFVEAAGSVALMRLEKGQLEADLKASTAELAASRVRLMETSHRERRRLERDLHDGVQQQLVSMRIRLDLAAQSFRDDPERGERELATIARQMDDALVQVRSLARGIYPSLLHERGLGEALKSAARISPVPPAVRDLGIGRYDEDVEVAVYFCCLEALQNVAKHAGAGAESILTLWLNGERLCFEVRDSGAGFDRDAVIRASGLTNMRDRVQAVGGDLRLSSQPGRGTTVRGSVPAVPPKHGPDLD